MRDHHAFGNPGATGGEKQVCNGVWRNAARLPDLRRFEVARPEYRMLRPSFCDRAHIDHLG